MVPPHASCSSKFLSCIDILKNIKKLNHNYTSDNDIDWKLKPIKIRKIDN